jgi:hypothetical protein
VNVVPDIKSSVEAKPGRLCLCCGIAAATPSIPACWDHWSLLPEGLRSSIVASYGRGELTRYAESLLEAIKLWREAKAWRSDRGAITSNSGAIASNSGATAPKKSTKPKPLNSLSTPLNSPEARNVISFIERVAERRRSGLSSGLERPRNEWRPERAQHEHAPVVSPSAFFERRTDLLRLALSLFRNAPVGSWHTQSDKRHWGTHKI